MMKREDIRFVSKDAQCAAWLYLPEGKPAPVIVMAHGLGGVKEMRLDAFAERFCQAGYACLVFDYRGFGGSEGQPRQWLNIPRQLEDWAAAIAHARQCPQVDGTRVVLWGTSFSGGHVISAGVQDGNVAAVIGQCPFTDGIASALALHWLSSIKATSLALVDFARSFLGLSPQYIATAGKEGSAALMSAPDALPGYLELAKTLPEFPNFVAARFALQIGLYRPGVKAAQLKCPAFFALCQSDTVAPFKASLKHLKKAPKATIKEYQEGHFDIYVGEPFERISRDEISFLKTVLPNT